MRGGCYRLTAAVKMDARSLRPKNRTFDRVRFIVGVTGPNVDDVRSINTRRERTLENESAANGDAFGSKICNVGRSGKLERMEISGGPGLRALSIRNSSGEQSSMG